ncbi:MAG: hypothetical protein AB7U73_10425 [Pirellulales bacterium]
MNQIVTIVKIAGKSSRILLRTFERWTTLRALGPEGRSLLDSEQWQPEVRNEMDRLAARIIESAAQPPTVFYNQHADLWSGGFRFIEVFQEISPPVGNDLHEVLGDEFELLCYALPDGGALDDLLRRRLRRRGIDDEARWYWRVLREAISSWQPLVEESVLVVVRRVVGGLVTDEETTDAMSTIPDWVNLSDLPASDA